MTILVTGGAGFIGSAFVRMSIGQTDWRVVNFDKLTYAGNLENLTSVADNSRYRFVHGDICDQALVDSTLAEEKPDAIVHFAAESHVDRSILSPEPVIQTNFRGSFTMLEAPRRSAIRPRLHRRSVRQPGGAARSHRKIPAECQQPLLRFQSRVGFAGAVLLRHLQIAG